MGREAKGQRCFEETGNLDRRRRQAVLSFQTNLEGFRIVLRLRL